MTFTLFIILLNIFFYVSYFLILKKWESFSLFYHSKSGLEISEIILNDESLSFIPIQPFGKSCYDWNKKTVFLRMDLYKSFNMLSVCVASHECSHAIQHKRKTILSVLRVLFSFVQKISFFVIIYELFSNFLPIIFPFHFQAKLLLLSSLFIFIFYFITLLHELEANYIALEKVKKLSLITNTQKKIAIKILLYPLSSYFVNVLSSLTLCIFLYHFFFV